MYFGYPKFESQFVPLTIITIIITVDLSTLYLKWLLCERKSIKSYVHVQWMKGGILAEKGALTIWHTTVYAFNAHES